MVYTSNIIYNSAEVACIDNVDTSNNSRNNNNHHNNNDDNRRDQILM